MLQIPQLQTRAAVFQAAGLLTAVFLVLTLEVVVAGLASARELAELFLHCSGIAAGGGYFGKFSGLLAEVVGEIVEARAVLE